MKNFLYNIPTKVYFGMNQINHLNKEIKKYGDRILLTYGHGSIKNNGIYQKLVNLLESENIKVWELGGIDPNPRIESVRVGIEICRENNIDLVLAVGGGSTIDCSKAICAGFYYDGDPWDLFIKKGSINKALPLGTILTMAATGSEMNSGAVISNLQTNQKLSYSKKVMAPKFSILDPSYTYSVSKKHTAAGVVDIMSHTLENYFSPGEDGFIQNRFAEGILKTCIKYGPIALKEPEDYEARANLMWASSLAINGILSLGKGVDWTVHTIEHELSAYYDITHGIGLAVLTPIWMDYVLDNNNIDKFVEYGVNVWNLDKKKSKQDIAREAIELTKEFFKNLGIPMTLRELGVEKIKLEEMAKAAVLNKGNEHGFIGGFKALDWKDVYNIYMDAF